MALFNESKQAMSKYDWQMNEILQMVNEEKQVRGHLRSLASKLIEEVDSLRSQTAGTQLASSGGQLPAGQLSITHGSNSTAWKNRCSERRDRINAQNMQIALEKEFQAKEQLIEENNSLKQESDLRQHKINELQQHIELLGGEIKELRDELALLTQQKAARIDADAANLLNSSMSSTNQLSAHKLYDTHLNGTNSLSSLSSSNTNTKSTHEHKLNNITNSTSSNLVASSSLMRAASSVSTNSSSIYSHPPNLPDVENSEPVKQAKAVAVANTTKPVAGHKFEVISFSTIERCEYCCGILYGICRQAVRCEAKGCRYLCHPKCRQYLPANCPININQRVQLKGVDFTRGIGTLMQGSLKVPKLGGVKKGWIDHYVFLSNARLFVCPIVDNKPSLIPAQIVDIKDPQFLVSKVSESDVIHANKRDIKCIMKMIVSKLKNPAVKQQLLFCAKDEKDRDSWINVLKDLNERLVQASKSCTLNSPASILLPIEAKEICDASIIRNASSACVYDQERLLVASDEGIDVIDIKTDCTIQRFHDKKTFLVDVFREEKLIVSISGKHHQIFMFPTIVIEGIVAEVIRIEETKGCNLFCIGKLAVNMPQTARDAEPHSISLSANTYTRHSRLLCVAVKKVVSVYEINSSSKPKYKKLRDIELTMMAQSMQIINNQLCIGFQSEFALYSLGQEAAPTALLQPDRDKSLQFLIKDPINALMAVQITHDEYLLVFESKISTLINVINGSIVLTNKNHKFKKEKSINRVIIYKTFSKTDP